MGSATETTPAKTGKTEPAVTPDRRPCGESNAEGTLNQDKTEGRTQSGYKITRLAGPREETSMKREEEEETRHGKEAAEED